MVNGLEIVFLENLERATAAATGSAMDEVVFGFVQRVDLLLEIGRIKIDVGRAGDVVGFEFLGRADVENHHVGLSKQLLSVLWVNMLDRRRSGLIGSRSCEKAKRKSEREQDSTRKKHGGGVHKFGYDYWTKQRLKSLPSGTCCQQRLKVNTSETTS